MARVAPRNDDDEPIITAKLVAEVAKKYRYDTHKPGVFTRRYRVICADAPWKYSDPMQDVPGTVGVTKHYPSMTVGGLCDLTDEQGKPIQQQFEDNAVLFLWLTAPMLEDALEVVSAWGFTYNTDFRNGDRTVCSCGR